MNATFPTAAPDAVEVPEAAVAALLCDGRLLLARRQPHLPAFPGFWSFPGGKVDPADRLAGEDADQAVQRALARELEEELGLQLAALLADHQVADIALLGEATTPAFTPTRFRTHFFRIALRSTPAIVLDSGEFSECDWLTPEQWLQRWRSGRLLLAPPTRAVIEALAEDLHAERAPGLRQDFAPAERVPWFEPVAGLRQLLVRSNTIPPAQHTNCFYIDGGAESLLVDPAPRDDEEFDRLAATVRDWPLGAILLTHHHPDHVERANRLARTRHLPIYCSADTHSRLRAGRRDWFDGVTVRELSEGERCGRWQGEAVQVIAVPGHDAGQLAPLPESHAWCIVSDLIQGIGTVVVGGQGADMGQYFASLQRVIDLAPAVVLPSHGSASGSTWKLEETLRHRRQREAQVLALHRQGQDVDSMLESIYGASTPAFLLPLARINIRSHLHKLAQEGQIAADSGDSD